MVRPAHRRALVVWARTAYQLTERRACYATGVQRSLMRYRSVRPSQQPLRSRLQELARVRINWGCSRLYVLLRREGWAVNHKRVERIYREEGLTLRRRRPKRRRSAAVRVMAPIATTINERWAMDFMHDTLSTGTTIRVLTVIDLFTRECVLLVAGRGFRGETVARLLTSAGQTRGRLPQRINVDNGTEFTSQALDHWAYWNHVQLDFSRPGTPSDNPFAESFNASVRRECLSQHWFLDLEDAQRTLDRWKAEYNNERPHMALARLTPTEFRIAGGCNPRSLSTSRFPVSAD
jgi:putative transposase